MSFSFSGTTSLVDGATDINISHLSGGQQEEAIAIDPTNPSRMFVFTNDDVGTGMFAAWSSDAGQNWTNMDPVDNRVANGSLNDPLPTNACCDPTVAWDRFGNLFIGYLDTSFNTVLALSTDGGHSVAWTQNLGSSTDQPTVVVGPGSAGAAGSVWVTWNDGATGRIAARGAAVNGLGNVGTFTTMQLVPSTSPFVSQSFGDIVVGPAGQAVVTFQNNGSGQGPDTIYTSTDADGLGANGFANKVVATATNVGGFDVIPAQPTRTIDAEAGLAWDVNPLSSRYGRLYLVYTDETADENSDTDIFVRTSTDGGANWSARVRVNDDATTRSQFNPRIAIDFDTGYIGLSWYDARNDAGTGAGTFGDTNGTANDDVQFFASASLNGGTSFLANIQVSEGTSNHFGTFDHGDYSGLAFVGGSLYPAWGDNSNSTANNPNGALNAFDTYTDRVVIVSTGGQTLTSNGGSGADRVDITTDPTGTYVQIWENNATHAGTPNFTATVAAVVRINVNPDGGNDTVNGANGPSIPTSINGSFGDDNLTGGPGNDSIYGSDGNDDIFGGPGQDKVYGDIGTDHVYGGNDADTVQGGPGTDSVYGEAGADLVYGDDTSDNSAYADGNDFVDGGSENDTLVGDGSNACSGSYIDGDDSLYGRAGNDVIYGDYTVLSECGYGNDLLQGDDDGNNGNDTLDGMNGSDRYVFVGTNLGTDRINESGAYGSAADEVDFSLFTASGNPNVIDISFVGAKQVAPGTSLNLWSASVIEYVKGSNQNDQITGNTLNNSLMGNSGNDTIVAGAGSDTLEGGGGDDTLQGQAGGDTYFFKTGTLGVDTAIELEADTGTDLLDFGSFSGAIDLDLATDINQSQGANLTLKLTNNNTPGSPQSSFENVRGSSSADTIRGNTVANTIFGGNGNDTIWGRNGNDSLLGEAGADSLFGEANNDSLVGGTENDTLQGGADNDSLQGNAGDDSLLGGTGDDTYPFVGGSLGSDVITELAADAGIDTIDFSSFAQSVNVDLGTLVSQSQGSNLTLRLTDILGTERLKGTSFADTLAGNEGNNTIWGGSGNDSLLGGDNDDELNGDAGTDTGVGGAGNDVINCEVVLP